MSTNMIPWFVPKVGDIEIAEVSAVIKSGYINDGELTREFEQKIADFLGVQHCIAVTSGTIALTLSLMGLGVGRDDEVIVPNLTFIATANAARLAGADVKLVDVEPERFTLDPQKVLKAITPKTRAIITVDVNGRGADYQLLEKICQEHQLHLICDSAEALGSKWNGKFLGTFGQAGCFSFSPNKTLTTGQGGMIATNNTALYYRLKELKDQGRRFTGTGGDDLHPVLGFNFKFTNIQSAIGVAQFSRLAHRLAHANQRDAWYSHYLSDIPGVRIAPLPQNQGEVRQWTDILCEDRAKIKAALDAVNISSRCFWFPLHHQQPYLQPNDNDFTHSTSISKQGLWLPSSFDITEEQIKSVSDVIREAASA